MAIYAFCIVTASLYIGAYVLSFFGISLPVLRVAGGIIVSMSGWRMLTEPDATEQRRSEAPYPRTIHVPPSRLAFYPLTMPLTTGPGTISVAVSIGAGRPSGFHASSLEFFVETLAAVALISHARLWVLPALVAHRRLDRPDRHDDHRAAFGVPAFCIGIQVFWNGASELLGTSRSAAPARSLNALAPHPSMARRPAP